MHYGFRKGTDGPGPGRHPEEVLRVHGRHQGLLCGEDVHGQSGHITLPFDRQPGCLCPLHRRDVRRETRSGRNGFLRSRSASSGRRGSDRLQDRDERIQGFGPRIRPEREGMRLRPDRRDGRTLLRRGDLLRCIRQGLLRLHPETRDIGHRS